MSFKPIKLEKFIADHMENNPKSNEQEIRTTLQNALKDFKSGVKCSCGLDIWVIGSSMVGNNCFNCITGEHDPSNDFELAEALPKNQDLYFEESNNIPPEVLTQGRFFTDDGEELNPDLFPIPSLCLGCVHYGDPNEEILCTLTRLDQAADKEFVCHAFKNKNDDKMPF